MKHFAWLCLLLGAVGAARADQSEQAATGVMKRVFPSQAEMFRFKRVPAGETPYYRVRANREACSVEGPDAVSMVRGAYDYLRATRGAQATWTGTTVAQPNSARGASNPSTAVDVRCPYRYVLQDNVCVFGYTTAFYGWKEWERYLDVMALHGVNMQFAPLGGEAIWDRVWTKLGIGREDLNNFFTGPAFLPWHRMGNINQHDGPLPKGYQAQAIALQKKILTRMRELGIEPVAPAFAGFVPRTFARKYPGEEVLPVDSWAGFTGQATTQILHPLSPMYARIGAEFIREWKREFGPAKFYLADSFNELNAPVSADRATRLQELEGFGKAVYDGIRAGDKDGTWVMQGWLFYNASSFWDLESVAALLKSVPDDKMLILDLFAEAAPMWKKHNAFHGKQWMVSTITTWGGNNQAYGNFELYRKLSADTLVAPEHGKLVGYGISFEGSESNEVQYELMCDSAWRREPISLDRWLRSFVRDRYGAEDEDALSAWRKFEQTVYRMGLGIHPNHLMQSRPYALAAMSRGQVHDSALFRQGVADLLRAGDRLGGNPLYRADVIQFAAQLSLIEADYALRDAVLAADEGEATVAKQARGEFERLCQASDQLLAEHPLDRLDRWVAMARAWGKTPGEKSYYEADAKRQVTVWGGPVLTEYAAKMWSRLITEYYMRRWQIYLDQRLVDGLDPVRAFEEKWIQTPMGTIMRQRLEPVKFARELVASLPNYSSPRFAERVMGTEVGGWKTKEITTEWSTRTWDISQHVDQTGGLEVRFHYTSGACRLDIRKVELIVDERVVATDEHFGRTGLEHVANVYRLRLDARPAGAKIELRAQVRTDGGNDSNGIIYLRVR